MIADSLCMPSKKSLFWTLLLINHHRVSLYNSMTFSECYWQTIKQSFPELISNNTNIFRELLVNNATKFSTFHIIMKQYWHFLGVTGKQHYISSNTDTFRELLANNIDLFRAHEKEFTLSQSYYQTIVNTFFRVSMDTWADRKFSNRKSPCKSEKS